MAHSLSAKKRIRQNAKRRMRNRARMSAAKTQVKHYLAVVKEQNPDTIETELRLAQKKIDRLADKGIIHKNKASRQKSQLAKIRNQAIANA
ncbi:MAG: 30S ribosomal protein S20 [Phycisphaerae bacterium]|nr:30S ribosomal protein S20 [Phycisphaerae bacterium]